MTEVSGEESGLLVSKVDLYRAIFATVLAGGSFMLVNSYRDKKREKDDTAGRAKEETEGTYENL